MTNKLNGTFLAGLLVLLTFTPSRLQGQGTDLGSIRGNVVDASGGAVPKATVTITDLGTQITRVLKSNEFGEFEATGLKTGTYKVVIEAEGFSTFELTGVQVRIGEAARADGRLQVKGATESVVVSEQATLIQTETPTVSGTLTNAQITQLPRDSRDYASFLYLNPSITQSGASGSFKFLGAQSYGASFSLDGQRSNGGVFGEPTSSQPSLESIGELTVMSNAFTAEYAGIANIRVSTRRGGAAYHGSLFADNKNSALAAWSLTDKLGEAAFSPTAAQSSYPKPYFNLNEFGASLGGPVPKIKDTFFFAAFEKRILHRPVNIYSSNLPHASLLAGDFSRVNDSAKPNVPAGVTLTAAEVGQNTVGGLGRQFISIPSRLMNPTVAKLIQTYFPLTSTASPINPANGRLTAFYTNTPGTIDRNLGTLRIDHDFTSNDRIYGVYNAQGQESATAAVVSPYIPLGLTKNSQTNHTLSLSEVHLFGTTVVNEARGGFNRVPNLRHSNQTLRQFLQNVGMSESDIAAYGAVIKPETLDTYGHPGINYGSTYATFGTGGRNTYRPLDQNLITFGDTVSWNKGRHIVRAGADFVRNHAVDGFTSGRGNPRGLITYSGSGTSPLARFLMGMPADNVRYVNQFRPPMDVHNWETGFFAQDDFRIHPRLTLNLGLRYEVVTPFAENNDLLVNFDPTGRNPNGNKGAFVVPSESTLRYIDPRFVKYGVVTAGSIGLPRSLVRTDRGNIAPRLGAAWRFNGKSVLRGGYGLFYPTTAAQGIRDPLATNSFQVGLVKTGTVTPLSGWPTPMSGGAQSALSGLISGNSVPFDLKQPRIQQFNVTVERELGWETALRVSYVGTVMQRLISGVDYSMIPPSDQPFGTTIGDGVTPCTPDDFDCDYSPADMARMPFPGLSDYMISFQNFGHGRTHALQMEINRRFASGFTFNVSYTRLNQKATAPDTGNSSLGGTPYNQFDASSDYGTDAFTSAHRMVTYGVYEVPFGYGRRYGASLPKAADLVAGGWQISWQAFAKSGTGFTPYWYCDNCDPVVPGNIASGSIDATGGFYGTAFRPVVTGEPAVRSGDRIWDPGAFGLMPLGAGLFSDPKVAIRNLLVGPSTYGLNWGVKKFFRFNDRLRAELGADIQNILNHPLLSPEDLSISNLGSFSLQVNPKTLQPEVASVTRNPDFGRLLSSFSQDGVEARRTVRLRLRLVF